MRHPHLILFNSCLILIFFFKPAFRLKSQHDAQIPAGSMSFIGNQEHSKEAQKCLSFFKNQDQKMSLDTESKRPTKSEEQMIDDNNDEGSANSRLQQQSLSNESSNGSVKPVLESEKPLNSSNSAANTATFSCYQSTYNSDTRVNTDTKHVDMVSQVDWNKVKRRPVIVDNEMEQELAVPIGKASVVNDATEEEAQVAVDEAQSLQKVITSKDAEKESNEIVIKSIEGKLLGEEQEVLSTESQKSQVSIPIENVENEADTSRQLIKTEEIQVSIEPQAQKFKGNLKKQSTKDQPSGTRRVSFDPLALLLDAALEGELELVKKTATEVRKKWNI